MRAVDSGTQNTELKSKKCCKTGSRFRVPRRSPAWKALAACAPSCYIIRIMTSDYTFGDRCARTHLKALSYKKTTRVSGASLACVPRPSCNCYTGFLAMTAVHSLRFLAAFRVSTANAVSCGQFLGRRLSPGWDALRSPTGAGIRIDL